MRTKLLFCLWCMLCWSTAQAQTFAPAVHYNTTVLNTSNPLGINSADFNGDGNLDIAVTNTSFTGIGAARAISILRGNSNGTFTAPTGIPTNNIAQSIVAADFNGDGKPDMATVSTTDNTLSVYINSTTSPTNISFAGVVQYAAGTGGGNRDLVAADFNGDNRPDIAVANTTGGNTLVFINNPASPGTFLAPVAYATGTYPQSITYGDVDGDGKTDLVVGNTNSFTVSVLKGTGTGAFQPSVNYPVGDRVVSVQLANLTADARPEIIALKSPLYPSSLLAVLTNSGTGTFGAAVNYNAQYGTEARIVTADFNLDGKADLVTADGFSSVTAYQGNGSGGFISPQSFALGGTGDAYKIIVGDFNKDGRPDIATARRGGTTVTILLNTSPVPAQTITTGTLSATGYCAGSAVVVPYTTTGTFNAGNVFRVQLSDASGSFVSPTLLSTLTSTASSITAGIPAGVTNSSLYRFRVIATNPAVNGAPNSANITISSSPVAPITVTSNPDPADICAGMPVTLTASSSDNLTYTWSPNIALSSTTGATVTASPTTTTTYTVRGTNGVCSRTMSVTITVFEGCLLASSPVGADAGLAAETGKGATVAVYPNPAMGRVTISTPTAERGYIQVLNAQGMPVKEVAISHLETEVELSGLAPSLYLVQVVQGRQRTTRRLQVGN